MTAKGTKPPSTIWFPRMFVQSCQDGLRLLLVESRLPIPATHHLPDSGVGLPPVTGDHGGLKNGLQQRWGRKSPESLLVEGGEAGWGASQGCKHPGTFLSWCLLSSKAQAGLLLFVWPFPFIGHLLSSPLQKRTLLHSFPYVPGCGGGQHMTLGMVLVLLTTV